MVNEKDMSIEGKIGEKEPKRSTTVENIRQITPFYAKQTQFQKCKMMQAKFIQGFMKKFAASGYEKTNPIQTQLKPIQTQ